ncbi:MAG: histidine kinase [Muribaculaceae bacterium]|nr:histidine kinase [Muribaculaceae bacterium]
MGLYLLDVMRGRAYMSERLLDWDTIILMLRTLLPFVVLFTVNNYLLIPGLLLKNKIRLYFLGSGALVVMMWIYQYVVFMHHFHFMPGDPPPGPRPPHPHSLLPLPLLLDFSYSLLVLGANMAIALLFQRFDDRLKQESLTKANAENELAYLKAQINPHFYMNMLNNIHGMIEIDPEKAQAMVIDMSQLMRYMLYDSSQTRIPLANEIAFLENYLRIMRRRFPENRVAITTSFPTEDQTSGVEVPPLLSLVFVENAFKHGISYRQPSFVEVTIKLTDKKIIFRCVNSRHAEADNAQSTGIGLRNIRQRLSLIYGEAASLEIEETETEYIVNLSTPI